MSRLKVRAEIEDAPRRITMKNLRTALWVVTMLILLGLKLAIATALLHGQATQERQKGNAKLQNTSTSETPRPSQVASGTGAAVKPASAPHSPASTSEVFYLSSFADHTADGDIADGEDPVVRQAAIGALGNMNGTVLAIDPASGRILAMVNQKLALSAGAKPCSTIKVSVALTALSEGIITKETPVRLESGSDMNLTTALTHSNNQYFEALGRQLGFEKVSSYARHYGLGELAGINISGEKPGIYPAHEISPNRGGVGRMCSFGEGISMTPLQLGALVSAIANGGTLYYLQHPTTQQEVVNFRPVVKRQLEIGRLIDQISDGMAGAVNNGTARRVRYSFTQEEVLGKTGTCSRAGTRFGWFGSYANTSVGRIVVVVFLQGGLPTSGPKASEVAGRMYRRLYNHQYFKPNAAAPAISASASPNPATK
jgi:penicillin-binding protein 2